MYIPERQGGISNILYDSIFTSITKTRFRHSQASLIKNDKITRQHFIKKTYCPEEHRRA